VRASEGVCQPDLLMPCQTAGEACLLLLHHTELLLHQLPLEAGLLQQPKAIFSFSLSLEHICLHPPAATGTTLHHDTLAAYMLVSRENLLWALSPHILPFLQAHNHCV